MGWSKRWLFLGVRIGVEWFGLDVWVLCDVIACFYEKCKNFVWFHDVLFFFITYFLI